MSIPFLRKAHASPVEKVVFPTPVSVPVINTPLIKILLKTLSVDLNELILRDIDKKTIWHPYTQMRDWTQWDNKVIVRGSGFYLIDNEGRKYLDGTASMWCNVWGHGKEELVDKMIEQSKDLQHSTLFGLANSQSIKLAEKLLVLAKGMDKVFYSDNGSTAIEVALKMALHYWRNKGKPEKKQFISLEYGYHGDTAGAMSVGYIEKFFNSYKPLLIKVHRAPSPFLYKTTYKNASDLTEYCLEKTERLLIKYSSKCCAFIMESGAQIAGGVIIYPKNYQRKISKLCKKYDVLLILDEVATGFGRLGNMIEYLAQASIPDIVCFGKALTGGYFPLAATLSTKRIFEAFLGNYSENKHLHHGHTYTGHPLGCATALANLDLYEKSDLISQINKNSEYIGNRLQEFAKLPIVEDIRYKGLLAGVELAKDGKPIQTIKGKQNSDILNYFITQESLKKGVFVRSLENVLMIIPPLAIPKDKLKNLLDVELMVLQKVQKYF